MAAASDSDDESYDSEEERRQARLCYCAHERELQQQRQRQAALLREYQEAKAARRHLEEDAAWRKLQAAGGRGWAPDDRAAPGWGGRGEQASAAVPMAALRQHEQRWAWLEQRAAGAAAAAGAQPLAEADIPWPPSDSPTAYLHALIRAEAEADSGRHAPAAHEGPSSAQQQQRRQQEGASRPARRAYAKACLRWHPDKFLHRFGRALGEGEERARVLARVQAISQGLNQAWEEVQAEWD